MNAKIKLHDFVAKAAAEEDGFKPLFAELSKIDKQSSANIKKFRADVTKLFADYDKQHKQLRAQGYKVGKKIDDLAESTGTELLETQDELVRKWMVDDEGPQFAQDIIPDKLIGQRIANAERNGPSKKRH